MPTEEHDLLLQAVARNASVVLSLPSSGMLRHHKSRFLGGDDGCLLVESVPSERMLIEEMITTGKAAGVSFKVGVTKVVFATPVVQRIDEFRINGDTVVQCLRMPWPTKIQAIQRRSNYRVRVGPDAELTARVWRIGPRAILKDRPSSTAEIPAKLIDLSTGGMGVTLTGTPEEPLKIDPADRLRIEIAFAEKEVVLEAALRHPPTVPKGCTSLRAGLQFVDLEADMVGRQALASLTKLIGELQRAEVRMARLGLMSG
ncbi:MAG TPA: hypothetical protein VGN72_06265 [Tepidisphaeraceae bacterium]|nr:hypothetical protein [Tepidisphaeraceae bacterium]